MEDENEGPCLQDIQRRHRKERNELQAKIQLIKRSAGNDKKKKKEAQLEIVCLQNQLEERQEAELKEIPKENDIVNSVEDISVNKTDTSGQIQMTKGQKKREKRLEKERQHRQRMVEAETQDDDGPSARRDEMKRIKEVLKAQDLDIHEIQPDGNCMYSAIEHQLFLENTTITYRALRQQTAKYLHDNMDDFLPFLPSDKGDGLMNKKEFEKYCSDVANTKAWGGHLELQALSQCLKRRIEVIHCIGSNTVVGEDFNHMPNLMLTYHQHAYSLGEHYNSVKPLVEEMEENL